MTTQFLEGTWEEITQHATEFIGHKTRVTVFEDGKSFLPNENALDAIAPN